MPYVLQKEPRTPEEVLEENEARVQVAKNTGADHVTFYSDSSGAWRDPFAKCLDPAGLKKLILSLPPCVNPK